MGRTNKQPLSACESDLAREVRLIKAEMEVRSLIHHWATSMPHSPRLVLSWRWLHRRTSAQSSRRRTLPVSESRWATRYCGVPL